MANVKSTNAQNTSIERLRDLSFLRRRSPIDGVGAAPYLSPDELKPADPDVSQQFMWALQDGLTAAGLKLDHARHLSRAFTNILQYLTPAGAAFAAGDLTHAVSRGDPLSAATNAASLIPTVRPEASAARAALRSAYPTASSELVSRFGPAGLLGLIAGAGVAGVPSMRSSGISGLGVPMSAGVGEPGRDAADRSRVRYVTGIADAINRGPQPTPPEIAMQGRAATGSLTSVPAGDPSPERYAGLASPMARKPSDRKRGNGEGLPFIKWGPSITSPIEPPPPREPDSWEACKEASRSRKAWRNYCANISDDSSCWGEHLQSAQRKRGWCANRFAE